MFVRLLAATIVVLTNPSFALLAVPVALAPQRGYENDMFVVLCVLAALYVECPAAPIYWLVDRDDVECLRRSVAFAFVSALLVLVFFQMTHARTRRATAGTADLDLSAILK
jgi:lipopolysaccharide export LptBFGC system permease protein LptF